MIVWAMISQKGGAGKTTIALHLAVEAALRGTRTLLVDTDPQVSAATWADRRRGQSVDIDVISDQAGRLPKVLAAAKGEGYGLVIIDTAPHAGTEGLLAAREADLVLIPCRPSILDLDAITKTIDLCALARRPALVVLNAAPVRSRVVGEAKAAIRERQGEVCDLTIHERVALRHALVDGRVAQEYEPEGAASREIAGLFAKLHSRVIASNRATEIA